MNTPEPAVPPSRRAPASRPTAPRRRALGGLSILGVAAAACGQNAAVSGGTGTGAGPAAGRGQAGTPARGGIARIGLHQEPQTLNPYLVSQGAMTRVALTTLEGLVGVNEKSEYYPVLARELPTPQNAGVSADGRTVTYKLREGVKWSDGAAFSSADVAFTWEAIMARDNRVVSRAGYDLIEGVDTPDASTAVVRYKAPYAAYLTRFPYVLPKHVLGALPNMNEAPFNRQPVGTGPFIVSEWAAGDKIVLKRNPHYRDSAKPYLEGLTFLIVPSREAGIARLRNGEIDVLWDLTESSTPQLKADTGVRLAVTPSINVERLVLNLAAPADPADRDRPHPILADQKVRRALQHAIDTKTIIEKLYAGQAQPAGSAIHMGWAADPSIKPLAFDVNAAKKLLDEAGWTTGPASSGGIRAKGGNRLTLTVNSTAGDKARELLEQVLQEQWKTIGIDLQIKNLDSTALLAPWASNGPRARGNFDMLLYSTGPDIDPDAHIYGYFHSSQIPTASNNGAGLNFSRYANPRVDAALTAAQTSVDQARRKASYAEAQKLIAEDLPHLLLFARQSINAFRTSVQGDTANPWQNFTWDTQNWWLKQ